MFGADKGDKSQVLSNGKKLYIGIVQSRFNANITDALKAACIAELKSMGVAEKHLDMYQVAGALELGVTLQALAEKNEYDALIAIGCVIRGETYHFELVANESAAAITRVALDYKLPIINAVLTTENEAQAHERLEEKGKDAAHVAVEMANLINELA